MSVYVIGKEGFIASKLLAKHDYFKTSINLQDNESIYLNLSDLSDFDFSIFNNESYIIFLAAISSPDECNKNYENSYKINVIGTKYFIEQAIKRDANILFFSSDVVYGNSKEIVDENTNTNPFGNYAKMKDEIEKYFENNKNFKVFRLSYVLSSQDKYLSYLKSCVDKNEIAEVYHPFVRKVIYIEDLLEAIEKILIKWNKFDNQKFNICGIEDVSRKDIADFYNKAIGEKLEYLIEEPDESFWEARPKDINITSIYLEKLLERKPTNIQDAIKMILLENN